MYIFKVIYLALSLSTLTYAQDNICSSTHTVTNLSLPTATVLVNKIEITAKTFFPYQTVSNKPIQTEISYILSTGFKIESVTIYDLYGVNVRTFTGETGKSTGIFIWDGRDNYGTFVPVGIYLLNIGLVNDAQERLRQIYVLVVGK